MSTYIVLMGVQGAGKGTQAAILKEKLQIPHVSTGDLFRTIQTENTPFAQEVRQILERGDLVPDEITNKMVEQRLAKPDAVQGAILDGYPRSRGQASFLDELLSRKGAKIAVVPLLTLDRETAIKRAEGRRFSPDGKRVYNIYFNPPQKPGVDDVTGESLIQRDDDYREAVERRIDLFMEKTMPLINYYKERGVLEEINADQPVCEVAIDLLAAIVRKMLV